MTVKQQELGKFLWDHWDYYLDNVTIRFKDGYYHISCKKGFWAVANRDLKSAVKQAGYYFRQYWSDGEYDGTAVEKFREMMSVLCKKHQSLDALTRSSHNKVAKHSRRCERLTL